jgi:5-methylthioribose kinase
MRSVLEEVLREDVGFGGAGMPRGMMGIALINAHNQTVSKAKERAKTAKEHAETQGTSSAAWRASADAHRDLAAVTKGVDKPFADKQLATAKAHESLADEYARDEKGRFAHK